MKIIGWYMNPNGIKTKIYPLLPCLYQNIIKSSLQHIHEWYIEHIILVQHNLEHKQKQVAAP